MDKRQWTFESVKQYYGKILKSSKDLQTNACCTEDALPVYTRQAFELLHPEVKNKFFGCGSPIPTLLQGCRVLDLGCGSGRDCYLLSYLVGELGEVIGVDMTPEQLGIANTYIDYHTQKFGYKKPNIKFIEGYIEDLESAKILSNSVDLVVSNCVINLSPDKKRVFSEILRVLKPGGELLFSDVFSSRRVPQLIADDPILLGECLGGALYIEDFRRLLFSLKIPDYRVVSSRPIAMGNSNTSKEIKNIDFYSMTIRLFKLEGLEDRCEDYGQVAYYLGNIPESSSGFLLDDHHFFEKKRPVLVCNNTARMLQETRYGKYFRVEGDLKNHYGLFPCDPIIKKETQEFGGCC